MYKSYLKYNLIFTVFCLLGITACTLNKNQTIRKTNYNNKSIKQNFNLEPIIKIYISSKDSAQFLIKLNQNQLLFSRQNEVDPLLNKIKTSIIRFKNTDDLTPKDTFTFYNQFEFNSTINDIEYSYKAPAIQNFENPYRIEITDLVRNYTVSSLHIVDKSNATNRQNFLIFNENKTIHYNNYVDSSLYMLTKQNTERPIKVRYFKSDYNIALPPFSLNNSQALRYNFDSSFTIYANKNFYYFKVKSAGIYHLQSDTTSRDGFSLFKFNNYYPSINNAQHAILPLRYILSKQEYDDIISANNSKEALDNIWLKIGNDADNTKELIKSYYNRVKYSNEQFTSHVEGWKSDRGMMYTVLGEPKTIYKSLDSETWVYGEETNMRAISFTFNKVKNPFSDNDFMLNRNPIYKDFWYLAVDTWRSGKIYNAQ